MSLPERRGDGEVESLLRTACRLPERNGPSPPGRGGTPSASALEEIARRNARSESASSA